MDMVLCQLYTNCLCVKLACCAINVVCFSASDHIYWVDKTSRTEISRIKRDLTEREVIVSEEVSVITGIAVDWISGRWDRDMQHKGRPGKVFRVKLSYSITSQTIKFQLNIHV